MKTIVRSCLDGARKSRGVAVLIDVFRASNTILMLLHRGARSILPVATVEEAFSLKKKHPEYWLAGERGGVKIEGFDLGNSPHEVSERNVHGRQIILTTSAGTQGIVHAQHAERIFIGSFGNGAALGKEPGLLDCAQVDLLAIGTDATRKAVEDERCALYLKDILEGRAPQGISAMMEAILEGEGALRLKRLGQERDFPYCLGIDIFPIVPEVRKTNDLFEIRVPA